MKGLEILSKLVFPDLTASALWEVWSYAYTEVMKKDLNTLYREAFEETARKFILEGYAIKDYGDAFRDAIVEAEVSLEAPLSEVSRKTLVTKISEALKANPLFLVFPIKSDSTEDPSIESLVQAMAQNAQKTFYLEVAKHDQAFRMVLLFRTDENKWLQQQIVSLLDAIAAFPERATEAVSRITQSIPRSFGMLPQAPRHEPKGREKDLQRLKTLILSKQEWLLQIPIYGKPGVGKSLFLQWVLHEDAEIKEEFSLVLWADVGPNPDIGHILSGWEAVLGYKVQSVTDQDAAAELRKALSDRLGNSGKCLIFLDDVRSYEQFGSLNIGTSRCVILAATYKRNVAEKIAPLPSGIFNLMPLNEGAARDVLRGLAPIVVDRYPSECEDLLKIVQYLPIGIQAAGRLLYRWSTDAEKTGKLQELLDELIRNGKQILAENAGPGIDTEDEVIPSVAYVLQKCIEDLEEVDKYRFSLLRVYAPLGKFDRQSLGHLWESDQIEGTLSELMDADLLEPVDGFFQLHSMLLLLASDLPLSPLQDEHVHISYANHYLKQLIDSNEIFKLGNQASKVKAVKQLDDIWPEVRHAYTWAERLWSESDQACEWLVAAVTQGREILEQRLSPTENIRWLQYAKRADQRLYSLRSYMILTDLGLNSEKISEFEQAVVYLNEARQVAVNLEDQRKEAGALVNITHIYTQAEKAALALTAAEEAMRFARSIQDKGFRQRVEMAVQGLTAEIHTELLHNYDRALELLESVRSFFQETNDPKHLSSALTDIGNAYMNKEDFAKALEHYNQALEIAEVQPDTNWILLGRYRGNKGKALLFLNRYAEALEFLEDATQISQDIGDKITESNNRLHLGILCREYVSPQEAITQHVQGIELAKIIKVKKIEAEHWEERAKAHDKLGQHDMAETCRTTAARLFAEARIDALN